MYPNLPVSSGTTSLFPSFRFPIDHFWQSQWVHSLNMSTPNTLSPFSQHVHTKTWSLYEDDRRRMNTTETDALRRSARIYKLDRKTNEYVRGKMDEQDTV
jgi:hypothetical protein